MCNIYAIPKLWKNDDENRKIENNITFYVEKISRRSMININTSLSKSNRSSGNVTVRSKRSQLTFTEIGELSGSSAPSNANDEDEIIESDISVQPPSNQNSINVSSLSSTTSNSFATPSQLDDENSNSIRKSSLASKNRISKSRIISPPHEKGLSKLSFQNNADSSYNIQNSNNKEVIINQPKSPTFSTPEEKEEKDEYIPSESESESELDTISNEEEIVKEIEDGNEVKVIDNIILSSPSIPLLKNNSNSSELSKANNEKSESYSNIDKLKVYEDDEDLSNDSEENQNEINESEIANSYKRKAIDTPFKEIPISKKVRTDKKDDDNSMDNLDNSDGHNGKEKETIDKKSEAVNNIRSILTEITHNTSLMEEEEENDKEEKEEEEEEDENEEEEEDGEEEEIEEGEEEEKVEEKVEEKEEEKDEEEEEGEEEDDDDENRRLTTIPEIESEKEIEESKIEENNLDSPMQQNDVKESENIEESLPKQSKTSNNDNESQSPVLNIPMTQPSPSIVKELFSKKTISSDEENTQMKTPSKSKRMKSYSPNRISSKSPTYSPPHILSDLESETELTTPNKEDKEKDKEKRNSKDNKNRSNIHLSLSQPLPSIPRERTEETSFSQCNIDKNELNKLIKSFIPSRKTANVFKNKYKKN